MRLTVRQAVRLRGYRRPLQARHIAREMQARKKRLLKEVIRVSREPGGLLSVLAPPEWNVPFRSMRKTLNEARRRQHLKDRTS